MIYVVATAIGNRGDLSERARTVLAEASVILCEDTRRTGMLLQEIGIKKRLISYHDHNEAGRVDKVIELLKEGEVVALVTDAGTPCISDPGYRIVRACHDAGIKVSTVPGPSAVIGALSISGLPTDRFTFEGFLPPKGAKRTKRILSILESNCTSVIYESTHKIEKLFQELAEHAPDREIVIVRELTKTYEEILRGNSKDLYATIKERAGLKGEMVVLVSRSEEKKINKKDKSKFRKDYESENSDEE